MGGGADRMRLVHISQSMLSFCNGAMYFILWSKDLS